MKSGSSKITKGVGFQRGVYAFCRTFVGPFVNIILHIKYKPCKVRSRTFLCLGNHTQNLDPALMVIGTRRHMRPDSSSTPCSALYREKKGPREMLR